MAQRHPGQHIGLAGTRRALDEPDALVGEPVPGGYPGFPQGVVALVGDLGLGDSSRPWRQIGSSSAGRVAADAWGGRRNWRISEQTFIRAPCRLAGSCGQWSGASSSPDAQRALHETPRGVYIPHIYTNGFAVMETAKLFVNGNSQAVRLPKEYRFRGDEVVIKRMGNAVVLLPKDDPWQVMFDAVAEFPEGFALTREQPELQEREPIE